MDRDDLDGFDIPLTGAVAKEWNVPVIASGGCASPQHMLEVSRRPMVGLAGASIFHFGRVECTQCQDLSQREGRERAHLMILIAA